MIENSSLNPNISTDFEKIITNLGETSSIILANSDDPLLKSTLEVVQHLGDRIATFFSRIKKIIKIDSNEKNIEFVSKYFFKNFSRISENTKASRHIIQYVIKRPDWLKKHSDRIIESLKLLYSDLLALQIDCEEQYKKMFGKILNYDFGLDTEHEQEDLDSIINTESAYRILNIPDNASQDQIKKAFRQKAKKLHPDLNPGAQRKDFLLVKEAYKKLLNKIK